MTQVTKAVRGSSRESFNKCSHQAFENKISNQKAKHNIWRPISVETVRAILVDLSKGHFGRQDNKSDLAFSIKNENWSIVTLGINQSVLLVS